MRAKKVFAVVVIVIGSLLIAFSIYIKSRVGEGKTKIANAQEQVDRGNDLFSLNPVTKEVGKGVTGSVQKKINEANQEVSQYDQLAFWLKVGGVVFIALGVTVLLTGKRRS